MRAPMIVGIVGSMIATASCSIATPARAQEAAPSSDHRISNQPSPNPPIGVWASLAVGVGAASNRSSIRLAGGQAALFGSYGRWVGAYRRAGASGIDSGGAWDDALLIGWRRAWPNSSLLWAAGPSEIHDESEGRGRGAVGFTVQGTVNARVVGLGLSAFGAWRPSLSYIGAGLTLNLGWIP